MTAQEKFLYHQIHPAKLFVDWSTGLAALYPLWRHELLLAIFIGIVPSLITSLALVRFAHLEKYKESRFGRYISRYMTRAVEMLRSAGYALMAIGAWFHLAWLVRHHSGMVPRNRFSYQGE
jgi:hypothetical protein